MAQAKRRQKMSKLTFKKQPAETGLAAVGAGTPSIDIRLDGELVGVINFNDSITFTRWHPDLADKVTVRLIVPASEKALARNPNSPWMWTRIMQEFSDGDQAKAWVREHSSWVINRVYSIKAGKSEGVTA
jgi:hypothetical protein